MRKQAQMYRSKSNSHIQGRDWTIGKEKERKKKWWKGDISSAREGNQSWEDRGWKSWEVHRPANEHHQADISCGLECMTKPGVAHRSEGVQKIRE